jgi:hypothetical protein
LASKGGNDALSPGVQDVFLSAYSQVQGDRSGPTGRIIDLKNGVVTHYDPGNGQPQRIKVQQRNGFATLPTSGHDSATGATSNPAWANPELLTSPGNQLLSIANAIPRVYDGTDWTHYASERVVSNQLSESVFHTSQRSINVPDEAVIAGVTCSVWAERPNVETTTTVLYIGFKGADGAWVRTPQVLYDPFSIGEFILTYAKVIADSQGQYFWVIYNDHTVHFTAKLFDLNGLEIDSDSSVPFQWTTEPGYWDIVQLEAGGMCLAQPLHRASDATDGVKFSRYTQTAGSISYTTFDEATIHCRGKLAWQTNDLADGLYYLATVGVGESAAGRVWGYQIDVDAHSPTHEFNFAVEPNTNTTIDSLIGFPSDSGTVDEPTLTISFTLLSSTPATVGPAYDPQLRYSQSWTCTWGDVATMNRQSDYTCQVSRAFKHDDEYYSVNYYQSGSGQTAPSQTTVALTEGDYMIGSKEQDVAVKTGDYTTGSPKTFTVPSGPFPTIYKSEAFANHAVLSGDKVEIISSGADLFARGVPVGTTVLRWTLANFAPADPTAISGGRLVVASSSIATANGTWDVLGTDATGSIPTAVYTPLSNTSGAGVLPGTFTSSGTFQVNSMTFYRVDLVTEYWIVTAPFLIGASMAVSGNGTSANNGVKTIARAITSTSQNDGTTYGFGEGIWITTGSEASSTGSFTAVVTPNSPRQWTFGNQQFDGSLLIGPHTLEVSGSTFDLNGTPTSNDSAGNGYEIIGVPTTHVVTTDGDAITAEVFQAPLPTVKLRVPDDVQPYTFYLQSLSPDYSYRNARLIVTGDSTFPINSAVFRIVDVDTDPTHHILYCVPIDGGTSYRSQLLSPTLEGLAVTIVFPASVQQEYQPCWLMVPLTGTKPVVGAWERGIAYADWRIEGSTIPGAPDLFPLAVTSPVRSGNAWLIMLPYRAVSFTVGQAIVTNGQIANDATNVNESTIGLKQFALKDSPGLASTAGLGTLLPGPMCGEFTASGFHEQGVLFGFEAPFLVSQQVSDNAAGLTPNGTYQIVAVAEVTDEDSDRVFSVVSPPMDFRLTGDNNSATYGGRLLQPLGTDGLAVAKHFGVTNYKLLTISIYRTAYQDGVPTTERHKVTLDLMANALAPIGSTNDSGFSFPDEFTWNYKDENLDAAILPSEVLYTDKGYLPRFPAPAQRAGAFWKNRAWVIGYDGAIWMSGEKNEGDATWFFPGFRYVHSDHRCARRARRDG